MLVEIIKEEKKVEDKEYIPSMYGMTEEPDIKKPIIPQTDDVKDLKQVISGQARIINSLERKLINMERALINLEKRFNASERNKQSNSGNTQRKSDINW